jgi:hypothetical protein
MIFFKNRDRRLNRMKMKIKRSFIILLTGCLLFMIYGCSAAQEDVEIADIAEEEITVADEGQSRGVQKKLLLL